MITPKGTVVKPKMAKSDFQAKIREDETEVIFVYKGKVDVTAKGKTVTVLEGFGTEVEIGPPPIPQPLPNFKDFNPAEMATVSPQINQVDQPKATKTAIEIKPPISKNDPNVSPGKTKSVMSKSILTQYRIQLSATPEFKIVVLDKTEIIGTAFELKKQNIPDGNYYMRVAFIDALGGEGEFSQISAVIKDSVPPELGNINPAQGQQIFYGESVCEVSGNVSGASLVSVNGEVVFISPNEKFSKYISLKPGENNIRILAQDTQGNETIVERKVTYTNNTK